MPSEHAPAQSQQRPSLGSHRSTTSVNSQTGSPSTSPSQHPKQKQKHVVGGGRIHTRVHSSKGLHKLTKAHGNEASHTELKKLGKNSSSTTSLKRNTSTSSLKRNHSSADIPKRPKSSHGQTKRPASVHFEIGDQDDAWEEASSSASPALSRSASRSAVSSNQSSAKPSANNSQPQSPVRSPIAKSREPLADGSNERPSARHAAHGKIITERLLQRIPSHNTTKMSLATATPMGHSPDSLGKSQGFGTLNSTPKIGSKEEVVSRFVGGSGTPSENSPFLHQHHQHHKSETLEHSKHEEVKRAHSMGNLTRQPSAMDDDEEEEGESALAPRSRKSSTSHAYIPPQQSRTQQKLWLQRASSNIEPQHITPAGAAINGLSGIHGGGGLGGAGSSLVGAGYDGRDPRIRIQLERTGLEYLVVRRHQDPVGKALKRLQLLPGVDKNRRIPPPQSSSSGRKADGVGAGAAAGAGAGRYGLSQSLKESRNRGKDKVPVASGARSSYEGHPGSVDDPSMERAGGDDGVGALLRSIWDKSYDLSASAD